MMTEHGLEVQTTSYLRKLEKFYLLRWKNDFENLNSTTKNLQMIRDALDLRFIKIQKDGTVIVFDSRKHLNTEYGVISSVKFPKDEDRDEGLILHVKIDR